ncbi:hypothetical protein FO519_006955 [Halicephalobus sp. NKZ332]|nr:hypothetical protein FO519_006955 [Halicephalobus sp. NKZ332]
MVVHLPGLTPGRGLSIPVNSAGFNLSQNGNGLLPQNATPMDRLIMAAGGSANAAALIAQNAQLEHQNSSSNLSQSNSGEASPGSSHSNQDLSGDAEGVWSPDIDQAFHEALAIYPPCGRRKIILSDEGKMYGRNELIARYIKIRCGKTRTRKQVSSHIQVLARKKQRETQTKMKGQDSRAPGLKTELLDDIKPLPGFHLPTSADPSAAAVPTSATVPGIWPYGTTLQNCYTNMDSKDNFLQQLSAAFNNGQSRDLGGFKQGMPSLMSRPIERHQENEVGEHSISSSNLTLCGFEAYVQQPAGEKYIMLRIPKISEEPIEMITFETIRHKYPPILEELIKNGPPDAFFLVKCWANVDFKSGDPASMAYAVDSVYDSKENFDISVSTKVCSFGKQVVEKVEVYSSVEVERDGITGYNFQLEKSPMCEYMVRFIAELKKLEYALMNSVLDNFTVLQIVTNKNTGETLMVVAFILEVSPDPEPTCRIYRVIQ